MEKESPRRIRVKYRDSEKPDRTIAEKLLAEMANPGNALEGPDPVIE